MNPPEMSMIRAWWLRIGDLVWQPDCFFVEVYGIESDPVGMMRVELADGTPAWFGCDDLVRIPRARAAALEWNCRRRLFSPEVLDELVKTYGQIGLPSNH